MNPNYPVYVISKGRWKSRQTVRALLRMSVSHKIVIESQEYDDYASVIDPNDILVLPFSNLDQGSIPARNWVWDHSMSTGHDYHWILDDNIRVFMRLNRNMKIECHTGAIFRAAEDFVNRYENVPLAGFQYIQFAVASEKKRPYKLNTRIYSCILIRNDLEYKWRGKYNEDTDLSIRVLKAGYCTMLFNAFLCEKKTTMTMKGGNTDELYEQNEIMDGRLLMAESLRDQHPDIVRIGQRWNRWQHYVDYSSFEKNKLIKKPNINILEGVNNYGMRIVELKENNT